MNFYTCTTENGLVSGFYNNHLVHFKTIVVALKTNIPVNLPHFLTYNSSSFSGQNNMLKTTFLINGVCW